MSSVPRPRLAADWVSKLQHECNAEADVDDNPPSEILEGFMFLGDCFNANSLFQLRKYGISRILSITTTTALGAHDDIPRLFLNIRDSEDEDIAILFAPACAFLQDARVAGEKVLVHCMAGRSRSATLVLAFLMQMERIPLHDAFLLVKEKRPIIFPNVGFWQQLMEEEVKVFGSNSQIPSAYTVAMEIHSGVRELSPGKLLKKYITAESLEDISYSADQKLATVRAWPDGWPASKCINDLFMASIEHMQRNARTLAVEFISRLLSQNCFTLAEVMEAFSLLQAMDLEELRLDVPKVDEYIAEMLDQAEVHGLLGRHTVGASEVL